MIEYQSLHIEEYRALLHLAKEHYRFIVFEDFAEMEKLILWRHDVDFSPHRALRMAEIEKEAGVISTYFIQPSSAYYNPLEPEVLQIFRNIALMGHAIGLHFSPEPYDITDETSLCHWLAMEKQLLESLLQISVSVFSFHNPTPDILQFNQGHYADMINTYGETIKKRFFYCSDSNGYWRHDKLRDLLENTVHSHLHVLTHPIWWQEEIMTPREKVTRSIQGRADKQEKLYDALLQTHGRINVR